MPEEPISIIGTLKRVIFYRDNFLISNFAYEEKRGLFIAKGIMDRPEPGLAYKLRGNWVTHPKFGEQFSFLWYEVMQPKNTEGIYKYIVRVCKWVGPTVASLIVEKYGDKTLEVLKESPSKVALQIKGLTKERAKDIQQALVDNEKMESVIIELEQIFAPIEGIPRQLAFDCAQMWEANAVVRLKENPYLLTRIKGIGFPSADRVALSLGVDRKARSRQMACIAHLIRENMHEGHVWMPANLLREGVLALIGICEDEVFSYLLQEGTIFQKNSHYALHEPCSNESYVAQKLIKIMNKPFKKEKIMVDFGDDGQAAAEFHLGLELKKRKLSAPAVSAEFCEDCGVKIPKERLEAMPSCTRCVTCQEQEEMFGAI